MKEKLESRKIRSSKIEQTQRQNHTPKETETPELMRKQSTATKMYFIY